MVNGCAQQRQRAEEFRSRPRPNWLPSVPARGLPIPIANPDPSLPKCEPLQMLTKEDVRQIVREELARARQAEGGAAS
jgi:hypothetical protein